MPSTTRRQAAAALGMIVMLLSLAQLFLGSAVGVANNGDGARLMCKAGVWPAGGTPPFSVTWDYAPAAGTPVCQEDPVFRIQTSWSWVVRPTVWLYQRLAETSHFDLRALGVVDSALLGLIMAALVLAWPGTTRARLAAAGAVAVASLDISFVTYFNSPLSEAGGFLGLLALLVAAVWLAAAEKVGVGHLLGLTAAAAFVALDKNQLAPIVLLVIPLLLWRPVAGRRVLGLVLSGLLLLGAGNSLASTGPGFVAGNNWNLWFGAILQESPDPARDLKSIDVDPTLARYAGTSAWGGKAGWFDPAFLANKSKLSRGGALAFLGQHPERALQLLRQGVIASTTTRTPYLSNVYQPGATAVKLTSRPNPAELLLGALRRVAWPCLPLGWLLAALLGLRKMRHTRRVLGVTLYVLGGGALLLCAAGLGDGFYELIKHEVYAGFLSAILIILGLVELALAMSGRNGRRPARQAFSGSVAPRQTVLGHALRKVPSYLP